jgi:hypothetical protein
MSKRPVVLVVALLGGCGGVVKSEPTSVPIGSPRTAPLAIERDDLEASRRRVLGALDAGDFAAAAAELSAAAWTTKAAATSLASVVRGYDAPSATPRPRLLANVTPLRVGPLPSPPARDPKEAKLVASPAKAPPGLRETYFASAGRSFHEGPSSSDAMPSWLPARLGDKALRQLRPSDGRWIALWADRYVAILGGAKAELLDFGAWSERKDAERMSVEWADVAGDVLYVAARRPIGGSLIAAVAIRSGKVLWRSENGAFTDPFAIADRSIVAWKYGEARGRPGQLVTLRRDTGVTAARRATPEVESGDCHLVPAGGIVSCLASSELMGGKGLKHDDALEIQEPAPAPLPAPPEPSNASTPAVATLPPLAGADARLLAWRRLDEGDPRAAIFALRPILGERPTDVAALALDEIARAALDAAREEAAKAILARPPVVASDTPTGSAPVRRSRTRRLVVASRRSITPDQLPGEFPFPTDDELLPPAWVPETLGNRRRNADAGAIIALDRRVEIYWGVGSPSLSLSFRGGQVTSVFEHPREVRASGAIGDVQLTVAGNGTFFLEARDGATGRLYYRAPEELHDQYFVTEDGYVVASTVAKPSADVVLLEADTGKVVGRVHLPAPQDPFLVFRKGGAIMAVNMGNALTLALE